MDEKRRLEVGWFLIALLLVNVVFNVTLVTSQFVARAIFKIRVWNRSYQIRKSRMAEYEARKSALAKKAVYEQNRKEMLMEMFPDNIKKSLDIVPP